MIDDDPDICEAIGSLLSLRFDVVAAHDFAEAKRIMKEMTPDLVIVDIDLKNRESGIELCAELRTDSRTRHIPVVVLSGSEDQNQMLAAFESGADDFISKTTRSRELVARVVARVRRLEETEEPSKIIKCGNLTLNHDRLEVMIEDQIVPFSVLEFNLLKFFIENRERVMSRDQILSDVWQGSVVSNRTIDTHMVYLRKKLKNFDHSFATIYGAGYILKK